jgi:hypothetical protein
MFVECFDNNGIDYLRLVSSRRVTGKNGRKQSSRKVELNIGPLSRFDDGKPDYVGRLKQSLKDGTPIIDALLPFVDKAASSDSYCLKFRIGQDNCIGRPKYFSHTLLDRVFSELGMSSLMATIKHDTKLTYDLKGIVQSLVFGRILDPASKFATIGRSEDYFPAIVKEHYPYHVYDALDVIQKNKNKVIRRMNSSIEKGWGRDTELIYYDVTNFFFETEEPDDDIEMDGEIVKGVRKMGVSKEKRNQPIVQMGLFLDDMGIPISIEMFPGNTLDQATLRPALKNSIDKLGYPRFILVADRGLCSFKNILHLVNAGHGYIISKSIKKSKAEERKWSLDQSGYTSQGEDFKYKSKIVERAEEDENGKLHTFKEQVVVYWSRKFYNRETHQHKAFLEFIEKLKKEPSSFRVTQMQSRSLKRFLKKEVIDKKTGEILDSGKLLTMIDEEKLEEFTELMGYYQIVTSEIDKDPLDIIDKYHGLSQIEDQFRVMKGDLETRPIFVRTPEHIEAHLLLCMMALTIIRIIQRRLVTAEDYKKPEGKHWTYALSGERVQRALRKWKIEEMSDEYYRFCDIDDIDLLEILKQFKIDIPKKLYTVGELHKIKSQIKVFL